MNTLLWNIAEGILRHVLTYAAGIIVSGGYVTGDQGTQIVGAVMGLAAIAWSAYNKHQQGQAVQTALMTPVRSPPILSPNDPRDNTADLNRDEVKRVKG